MAWRQSPGGSEQHLTRAAAAARTRTQRPGKHLAVHASELVVKPDFQILRRYRQPLLLRLEHTHRPTLEDYVHRATRLGSSRSLNLRIGIMSRLPRARGTALYEAANVLLSRITRFSKLKRWGMDVAKRRGSKRAKVALARKIGIILHRMWIDGTTERWTEAKPIAAQATSRPPGPSASKSLTICSRSPTR